MSKLIFLSLIFLLFIFLNLALFRSALALEIQLGGYYKSLFIKSNTMPFFPPIKPYLLDVNRLRLKMDGELSDTASFNLQYDNEVFFGDYLDTNEFLWTIKNQPTDTYFDLDSTYLDNGAFFARHRMYRAYVDLALDQLDFRIGRQRIAWGTAMMWNPMDILNPFNPIQLERQERLGIDAMLIDWNYDALSRFSLVYAKQQSGDSGATRWRINHEGFDFSLMAGRFRRDKVAGFDFAGQVGDIAIHGEMTYTNSESEDNFTQAVVGAGYVFANSLLFNVELYYNGQGYTQPSDYDFKRLLTGEIQSLARRYLGGYLAYDFTPLLQWNNIIIVNLDDNSVFFTPSLLYSISDNVEFSVGVQLFNGNSGTEFGTLKDLYFVQLLWYF